MRGIGTKAALLAAVGSSWLSAEVLAAGTVTEPGCSGAWTDGACWVNGNTIPPSQQPPFPGDVVSITPSSSITLSTSAQLSAIDIGGTLNQSGGSLQTGSFVIADIPGFTGSYTLSGGSLVASGDEDMQGGVITQSGGSNTTTGTLRIGSNPLLGTRIGTYNLSDGTLTANALQLGPAIQTGILNQSGGSVTINGPVEIGGPLNSQSGLAGGNGTYNLSGGSLTVTGGQGVDEVIGGFGTGTFTQTGGTHTDAASMTLGLSAGGVGTYTLDQADRSAPAALTVGTDLVVGDGGSGSFTHNGGTNTVTGSLTLGKSAGGTGTYSLAQPQASIESSLSVGANFVVGDAGSGTFNQTAGAVTVGGTMTVGKSNGGNGIYNLGQSDSLVPATLTVAGDAIIGDGGFGTFTHTGGSFNVKGTLTIGNTASGSYSMSEADNQTITELTTGSNLIVGNAGTGSFTQAGGSVKVGDVLVLGGGGGTGTYTMTGSTSTLDADHEIIVNGTFSQSDGKNSIDQGKITTGLGGTLTINAAGNYNLSGGSLEVENTETIQGNFNQTGGSNGPDGGLTLNGGFYSLNGGTLTVGDDVSVFGGKFDQSGGAAHIGGSLTVDSATGAGSFSLSGSATLLVTKDEVIADGGKATFTQSGGTNTLFGGDLTLGKSAGGDGTYTLAQSDAQKQALLQVGGNLVVGDAGTGTFVHSGGTNTVNNDMTLGNADTGVGTYILSQASNQIASLLQVAGNAIIGNSGIGTFTQTGGTADIAGNMTLGASAGGNGSFTLNQADSQSPASLQIGGALIVGDLGTGAFTVTAGSATVGGALTLGNNAGSTGSLTLNQSDPSNPAALQIGGAATIGDHGSGTATLSGGTMTVGGALTLGNSADGNGGLTLSPSDNSNPVSLQIGGALVVGNLGTGSVSQTGGNATIGAALTLGQGASGSGSYTLSQTNGQNPAQLSVGGNVIVGGLGSGSLTATGGILTATGGLTAGQGTGSNGAVTLGAASGQTPATLQIGGAAIIGGLGTGTFNQTAGTATIGGAMTLGQGTTGKGTLTLAPSSGAAAALTIGADLVIGDLGTGTYDQSGGTATVGGSLIMGNGATGKGTATLSQASGQSAPTLRIGGNAVIGALGTGSFDQSGGSDIVTGAFTLGQGNGSNGTYSLSQGSGLASPTLNVGSAAVIGAAGTGSINQTAGTATFGASLTLGQSSSGNGSYALDQTGTLQVGGAMIVGGLGTGSVQQNGGVATIGGALTLGQGLGGSGSYAIGQGPVSLTIGGATVVGALGSGSITQSGGTVEIGSDLTLGQGASGNGTYTLGSSGGLASPSLTVGGNETIGGAGSGTFTQDGGANTMGGTLTIAAAGGHGTYNFAGGTLTAGLIVNNDTLNLMGSGLVTSNLLNTGNTTVTGGAAVGLVGTVSNSGSLSISGATLSAQGNVTNNGGDVGIGAPGSALVSSGTYTQNSGTTLLHGGTLEATAIVNNSGTIGGTGTLQGNVTVNGGTVQVGASPDPLHVAGNYTQHGGVITFEIDPGGASGFLESTLVFDVGAALAISGTTIEFDFLNGADALAFVTDGLFNLNTFFKVSNGDLFGQDFSFADIFQVDTFLVNLPGDTISSFDPSNGALAFAAGGGSTAVPEPPSLPLMLSALGALVPFAAWRRRARRG